MLHIPRSSWSSPNKLSLLLWDNIGTVWTQTVQSKRTSNIKWFCCFSLKHRSSLFVFKKFNRIPQSMCCAFHLALPWTSLFYQRIGKKWHKQEKCVEYGQMEHSWDTSVALEQGWEVKGDCGASSELQLCFHDFLCFNLAFKPGNNSDIGKEVFNFPALLFFSW